LAPSQPIFNAPRVILICIALLVSIHVGLDFLSSDQEQNLVLAGAFIPARFVGAGLPGGNIAKWTSFITHMALHGDYAHLAVNCGWLLAFGTIVARRIGTMRFLGLSLLTGVAGALLFLIMNWGLYAPMVGASGAISGLMGAAVRFMFVPRSSVFSDESGVHRQVPRMSLSEVFQDKRARLMIVSWVALNLLFGLVLDRLFSAGGIAWEAHLGGFACGLLVFQLFDGRTSPPDATAHDLDEING
jgi:membrane associated rhomboid family serine protease